MQRITNSKLLIEDDQVRATASGRTLAQFASCLEQIVETRGAFAVPEADREMVFGRVAGANEEVRDADLALVLCSSGSTGVPKGVALSHKNVITSLRSRCMGSFFL